MDRYVSAPPDWREPPRGSDEAAWIAWADGLPLFAPFGLRALAMDEWRGRFVVEGTASMLNPNGSVNGGVVALVVDQVMGAVGMRHTEPGSVVNTASLDLRYQRPAFAPLEITAEVTKAGRAIVFIDAVVRDHTGRLTNTAAGTMAVVPLRTAPTPER